MKIGILTFHTPINYGAVLQAYALQKYLKIEFPLYSIQNIDFKTEKHNSDNKKFVPFRRNIIAFIFHQLTVLLRYKSLKTRERRFKNFLNEELTLTKKYATETELLENTPFMDRYIVGSDQVFHPNSPYIKAYFLNFKKGNSKKIAYAPSFGNSSFTDEFILKVKPFLDDFDYLSCRESDGAMLLTNIVKTNVPVVVDPIFLLTQHQWSEIAIDPIINKKYIFVYDLNGGHDLIRIARQIKKKTGFKIICQTQHSQRFYKVNRQLYSSGPKEFIGLIKNAEYIVTDSFHGTAFSVLFKKPQFVYNAKPKASSRIYSLLNKLGLENRIIEYGLSREFIFDSHDSIAEYSEELNMMIENSKFYLKNAITK